MMLCTAFLSVKDVITALKNCSQVAQRTVSQFSTTLKKITWVDTTQLVRSRNRNCTLELLRAHKKSYPRTNNSVEGWNSNFVKLVNTKLPSLPKLIEKY